jgi:selenocysteine-specific elongation factor
VFRDAGVRSIIVGTAGHIDHGKSALVEALTGTDPDRLKEEKARGITIELGFAHAPLPGGGAVSFVDVPGHERFVRTMLAGVGGIDAVLLVVAAHESVMPQTREHFDICRVLQVPRGAVVLTKADLADAETRELARLEVRELVAGSFLDGAPIVTVSARTGEGLDELRATLAALLAAIPERDAGGAARLPVDRTFTMRGFGTVATGTLVAGRIRVDDELRILPGAGAAKVRGLHVHGEARPEARAGERVALNLAGVEVDDVPRGSVLAAPGGYAATRRADVELTLLPGVAPLRHGARVRVHHGTAEIFARVALAGAASGIDPGDSAPARLRLEREAVLARGDRFIIRTYSPLATVGGGIVLDPDPPRTGVRTARGAARFAALRPGADPKGDSRTALLEMLSGAGPAGARLERLGQRLGLTPARLQPILDGLEAEERIVVAGGWAVARAAVTAPVAALLAGLEAFHAQQPLADGVPLDDARTRWLARIPPPVVDRLVAELAAGGRVVARDTLALAGHAVALSPEESAVRDALEARFRAAGLHPPDPATLAAELGRPPAVVERVMRLLLKRRQLVRLDTLVFHQEALAQLKTEIAARKAAAPDGRATVDVKAFKDAYDVSRKFAIPLLEYLDRERVTRRAGDVRVVL